MVADPASVYRHEDFAWRPGLMLTYPGIPQPESDPKSVHAYHAGPKPPHGFKSKGGTVRLEARTLPPEREALTRAMRRAGWTYRSLAARIGVSDKALWNHLAGRGIDWRKTWAKVAEVLGEPELAAWVEGQR